MSGRRLPNRFVLLGVFAAAALLVSTLSAEIGRRREAAQPPAVQTPTPIQSSLTQEPQRVLPQVSAPFLRLAGRGWSPDGRWLAYWVSTQADVDTQIEPWPPAHLAFYDLQEGTACEHANLSSADVTYLDEWTADEAVVQRRGTHLAVQPCADPPYRELPDYQVIESASPARDPALSPNGEHRAVSLQVGNQAGVLSYVTTLNTARGEPLVTAQWQIDERLGDYADFLGGEWLNDHQFLIYETLEQGPLLLDAASGKVVRILPELFGQEQIPSMLGDEGYNLRAQAIPAAAGSKEHILLAGVGEEGNFPPVRLYHAEDEAVEELPYRYPYLSGALDVPGVGTFILMDARPLVDGYETHAVYLRRLEERDGAWKLLAERVESILWSGDLGAAATASGGRINWLSFPELMLAGAWLTRPYSTHPAAFSPDGCKLAALGSRAGWNDHGLFILQVC